MEVKSLRQPCIHCVISGHRGVLPRAMNSRERATKCVLTTATSRGTEYCSTDAHAHVRLGILGATRAYQHAEEVGQAMTTHKCHMTFTDP